LPKRDLFLIYFQYKIVRTATIFVEIYQYSVSTFINLCIFDA